MSVDGLVLVHGGFHGAWCWERLLPHLERPVLAVDLPGRGEHPAPMEEVTLEACVASVVADIAAAGFERIVLVGHSLGGATVPLVAARIPDRIAHLVLLSCIVAPEGGAIVDGFPEEQRALMRQRMGESENAETAMDEETHRELIGSELCDDDLRWALANVGPDSRHLFLDRASRAGLPDDLPRSYIRLRRDRTVPWELQDHMISLLPGLATRVIDAGHNVMVSHPRELAEVLEDIASQA
jgi:pimeloyl-ACP methyl ester carboxylesterase